MTLRLRLVLALVALLTVGLALYGFATYSLYAHAQYDRLDAQIAASVNAVSSKLADNGTTACSASSSTTTPGASSTSTTAPTSDTIINGQPPGYGPPQGGFPGVGNLGGDHGGRPVNLPPDTYAELRDSSGAVVSCIQVINTSTEPDLPDVLKAPAGTKRYFTTDSVSGSGQWRVLVTSAPTSSETTESGSSAANQTVVVAVPMGDVTSSLAQFVLIELAAAAALLAALSVGSWLILRRGLHPLEVMSTTAGAITAGDLTQRVSPSGGPTEVGQLGLALNTMLEDIEVAFNERDETERRLRQFLADASHELRTPITSIQGFAELFRVGADHAQVDLPTILRRIEEESARMKVLVEDLLLLAQLDQTRQVGTAPVDLAVLAADACSDAVAGARDRPVTLDAPEPVVVDGDEAHLRQAIANLVSNALRHTPAGTALGVSARREGAWAVIEVRDHGPGLDDEALAHVFDRFWQADRSRTGSGAGLGLAIVAGIATEHGGSVAAANAPDGGAIFRLQLPISTGSDSPPGR
jgi:two-component system, OmpR family, sensor kinase